MAAGLAAPHTHTWVQVSRYRQVDVPLYRGGDLEALCTQRRRAGGSGAPPVVRRRAADPALLAGAR